MLKSLMNTLSKSKPVAFRKDIHIYIQSRCKTEVYDVDTPSANPNPYKKHKGTEIDTSAIDHRTHCNGCGKQHKPPCRLSYKEKFNHENKPYAVSSADMAAAARRKLLGQECLKTIDMLYKDEVLDPNASTPSNHII